MWLIHLLRWSVAPQHQTAWGAVQTVATILATAASGAYLLVTYRLLRETRHTSEATLMQQLMVEYDALRDQVMALQAFQTESGSREEAVRIFRQAHDLGFRGNEMKAVDASRFRVSRFFVKIRKLATTGFLDKRLIAIALNRAAIEDVFLNLVDPLDQVITMSKRGKPSLADRDFYYSVLKELPELLR